MDELSEHAILWNTAALTSLKRQQLMSLSKRYGLKASGKNVDMVKRLHDYGQTLTPNAKAIFDMAASTVPDSPSKCPPTPGSMSQCPPTPGTLSSISSIPILSTHAVHDQSDSDEDMAPPQPPALARTKKAARPSAISLARRGSWEVLDEGDASLVEEEEARRSSDDGDSTKPWKSADNGKPLDDFGKSDKYGSLRNTGSLRSLVSSISRKASRTMSIKSSPGPATAFPAVASQETGTEADNDADEPMEEVLCPSPASTVNIPKRIAKESHHSSHHRPSTIRLVSPSPSTSLADLLEATKPDAPLPLTGVNSVAHIKERRSMKPLGAGGSHPPVSVRDRPSLPTLLSPASTSSRSRLYPALPTFAIDPTAPRDVQEAMMVTPSPEKEMPGSFPASPADGVSPTSPGFVFGTTQGVSNHEFSDAGAKLLAEFQAKMGGSSLFSSELLKGAEADVTTITASKSGTSLATVASSSSGKPGFGLAPGPEAKDRFAAAHARQFNRMKSLQNMAGQPRKASSGSMKPSASSGNLSRAGSSSSTQAAAGKRKIDAPTEAEAPAERGNKRSKPAPAHKPSIIDMVRRSRASSKSPVKSKGTLGRLGFLRGHKRTPSGAPSVSSPLKMSSVSGQSRSESPDSITSDGSYLVLPSSTPSDELNRVPPTSRLKKLSTKSSTLRAVKGSAPPRTASSSAATSSATTSAATTSGTASAASTLSRPKSPPRGAIPDFGPHKPTFQPLKDNSQEHGSTSSRASTRSAPPPPVAAQRASTPPTFGYRSTAASTNSISRSGGTHNLARMASGDLSAPAQPQFGMRKGFPSNRPSSSNLRQPSATNLRQPSVNRKASTNLDEMRSPSSTNLKDLRSPSSSNLKDLRSPSMSSIPRSRSSTLLAPTAASRARMQATVKPTKRPLPHPPKAPSSALSPPSSGPGSGSSLTPGLAGMALQPLAASSRGNFLFESNFHIAPAGATPSKLPQPHALRKAVPAQAMLKSPTKRAQIKSPRKTGVRVRASDIGAVKAANMAKEADVARRRQEMRGKTERLTQEKELRMMLG